MGNAIALRSLRADSADALADSAVYTPQFTGAVARTYRGKLAETFSPFDFGAIGNGASHPLSERFPSLGAAQAVYPHATALTNEIDWAAIQAAVNAATPAGVVEITDGTFMFGPSGTGLYLEAKNGVTIRGSGVGKTIFKVKSGVGDFDQLISSGGAGTTALTDFVLEDLTIDMNAANAGGTVASAVGQCQFAIKLWNAPAGLAFRRIKVINSKGVNGIVVNGGSAAVGCIFDDVEVNYAPSAYTTYDNSGFYLEGKNFNCNNVRAITTIGSGGRGGIEVHGAGHSLTNWLVDGYQDGINVVTPTTDPTAWASGTIPDTTGFVIKGGRAQNVARGIRMQSLSAWVGGTVSATGTTIATWSNNSTVNDAYKDFWVCITGGPGIGQYRKITGWAGATHTATVSPAWDVTPDATSTASICRIFKGDSIEGNVISIRQVAHDDAMLAAGEAAQAPAGICAYWDNSLASSGLFTEENISGNTITFEAEGDMHRRPGGSSVEAGISMCPYSNMLLNSKIEGNIIVRAPAKGLRTGGTTAPSSSVRNTRYANNTLIDCGQYTTYANQFDRAYMELNGTYDHCLFDNNPIHDTKASGLTGVHAIWTGGGTMTDCVYNPGKINTTSGSKLTVTLNVPGLNAVDAVSSDRGDANVTLFVGYDSQVQRFNTTLTANRTVTLSTVGAYNGARFEVIHAAATPGAFTLSVGGIRTLAASTTGKVSVRFDGTNWVEDTYAPNNDALIATKSAIGHTHPNTDITGLGTASTKTAGNAVGNVPLVESDGKLNAAILRAGANQTWTVTNQAAMLALSSAIVGDYAIQTASSPPNQLFYLNALPPSTLGNWIGPITGVSVSSVNGQTGVVSLGTSNIAETGGVLYYTDARALAVAPNVTLSADADAIFGLTAQQLTVDSQSADLVLASPAGAAGVLAPRALGVSHLPAHSSTHEDNFYNKTTSDGRFAAVLHGHTTTDVSEGTRLYYTTLRVTTDVAPMLAGKANLAGPQTFTGAHTFTVTAGNPITFDGDAGDVVIDNTGQISATLFSGVFSGSGASLTALSASNLASGTVPLARLSASSASAAGTMSAADFAKLLRITGVVDAGTITTNYTHNAANGSTVRITLNAATVTLNPPTNPQDGQTVVWELKQDATTGGRAIALSTAAGGFVFGTDIPSVTLSTGVNITDLMATKYNATANKWRVTALIKGFA